MRAVIFTMFIVFTIELPMNAIFAQNSKPQLWNQYYVNYKLSKRTDIKTDVSIRSFDQGSSWEYYLMRSGIIFHLSEKIKFNPSVAVVSNSNIKEFRSHLELAFKAKLSTRLIFMTRFRTEYRNFINSKDGLREKYYKLRTRWKTQFILPINNVSLTRNTWYIVLAQELFYHVADAVNNQYFDRFRLISGIGHLITDDINLAVNYNYQRSHIPDIESNEIQNVVWITIKHKI